MRRSSAPRTFGWAMTLIELQRALISAAGLRGDESQRRRARAWVDLMCTTERLDVYRRNAIGAMVRALEEVYPACVRVLGARCFAAYGQEYVRSHPSTAADLNRYGGDFPAFIANLSQAVHVLADLPYMSDLARLEWYWHSAYYAPPPAPFDFPGFARIVKAGDPPVHLVVAPGVAVLESEFPVVEIRQRNLLGEGANEVTGLDEISRWCVYATAAGPSAKAIDLPTYALLSACRARVPMGELANATGRVESELLARLTDSVQRGWINGFATANAMRAGGTYAEC